MNNIDVNQLLSQMRAMGSAAQGAAAPDMQQSGGADFAALLKGSIDKVNETQQHAAKLSAAFEAGDSKVDLAEVMIAMQKASISFQAITQDIMSMPV
jgi:flagellar hook-basal body complex protein FliE